MKLSVIVLNYKSKGLVRNLIRNIIDLKWSFPYEIIVIDNNSNDALAEMLEEEYSDLGNLKFLARDVNDGYGAGNNAGVKLAEGEYLLILNPDIVVNEGTVESLLDYMEKHQDTGIISPKLLYANKKAQQSYFRYYKWKTPMYRRTFLGKTKAGKKDLARFTMQDVEINGATAVDWLMGSFWLMPKSKFDELGGFDDRYFMYFEDADFCRRMNDSAYKVIYYPEATAIHLHARDSKSEGFFKTLSNKMTRIHIKSAIKYFRKFGLK